jgi:hypothetical protein
MYVSYTKGTRWCVSMATMVTRTRHNVTLYYLVYLVRNKCYEILLPRSCEAVVSSLDLDSLHCGLIVHRSAFVLLCYNTGSGSQMNRSRWRLRYDNVMPGQGYRTPQGAVWGQMADKAYGSNCRLRVSLGHTACTLWWLERPCDSPIIQFTDRRCFVRAPYTPLKELATTQRIPDVALKYRLSY